VTRAHNLRTRIHEQISSGPADRDEHFAP
jgi:hypothetical protein